MMFRKILVSLTAIVALGVGMAAMTSTADAHRRHHHHGRVAVGLGFYPFFGFGYPTYRYPAYRYPYYYDGYYDGCGYRRVAIKKWNKSHTHRVVIHRKRWVCY